MKFNQYEVKKLTFGITGDIEDCSFVMNIKTDDGQRFSNAGDVENGKVRFIINPLRLKESCDLELRLVAVEEDYNMETIWDSSGKFEIKKGRPPRAGVITEGEPKHLADEYNRLVELKEQTISTDIAQAKPTRLGDKVFKRFHSIGASAAVAESFDDVFDFILDFETDDEAIQKRIDRFLDDVYHANESLAEEYEGLRERKLAGRTSQAKKRKMRQAYRRNRQRILRRRKKLKRSAKGKELLRKRKRMGKVGLTAGGKRQVKYHRATGGDRRK